MANEPTLNLIMNDVLVTLSGYLSPTPASLPTSTVSVVSATKRNSSIGNRIGTDTRGGFPTVAIKGGHLDASVQFQVWDSSAEDIEVEMNSLHNRLMADKELLRSQGFIKLNVEQSSTSEFLSSLSIWRKTSLLKFLYEYQYQDSDDALSVITRIPIESDLEVSNSAERETSTVTDAMRRWDDESANTLSVVGNGSSNAKVFGLNLLVHLPGGWVGDPIIIDRTNLDSVSPPNIYLDFSDFIEAVTDQTSPDQNAQITLPSISGFVNALTIDGAPFELGDWDEDLVPDEYQAYQQNFGLPINLSNANDVFRIRYQSPQLSSKAVIYLRTKVT